MPMRLEIVTAERILFEGDVDMVVAPGGDGELAVLPHHAAVMTTLLPGELRYRIGTEENHYIVHGGFMDVRGGLVVVLADAAEHVNEIEEARAEEAIARAQQRITPRGDGVDLERALASLHRAQTRLKITRLRRKQRPVGIGSAPQ
jgi:F-type H+-transporting ATPase subunit epsilon